MTYQNLPDPTHPSLSPTITIRPATPSDAPALADAFYTSFSPSSPFWSTQFPSHAWHKWWIDAWRLGIESDPSTRTFVATDSTRPGKVVGFSRWVVPQQNGSLERLWPEPPPEGDGVDMQIVGAFFGGMAENREGLMGMEPHWFLELLGTDAEHQGKGIGYALVKWGCDLADQGDLKVYIDASEKGAPFYRKHFGAEKLRIVTIPDRTGPGGFGHYEYWTHVVPKKSERERRNDGREELGDEVGPVDIDWEKGR